MFSQTFLLSLTLFRKHAVAEIDTIRLLKDAALKTEKNKVWVDSTYIICY